MIRKSAALSISLSALLLAACQGAQNPDQLTKTGATPKAACGPGSNPETGLQGRVSRAEHDSGRAAEGYTCNTELVGQYTADNPIGTVGGFKVLRYVDGEGRECAYYDTTLLYPTNILDANAGSAPT